MLPIVLLGSFGWGDKGKEQSFGQGLALKVLLTPSIDFRLPD